MTAYSSWDPQDAPDAMYECQHCGDEHYIGQECPLIAAEDAAIEAALRDGAQ